MRDEEIIDLYFERNELALSETEKKYKGYCFSVAENILGDRQDAEECVNSALLGVWNSVPPNRPKNLKMFVAKTARNIALNKLKAKLTQKRGGNEVFAVFEELSELASEDTESDFEAKELGESINRFAGELKERERNIFIRRYFFMESPGEIGERYKISPNGVSVILHRLRKKLKKHLEKEGFDV